MKKVLECSSQGDRRFSAFFARITLFGVRDSIENHYQLSKRFGDSPPPTHWRECKGRAPTHFDVQGFSFPLSLLSQWYQCLWLIYLDQHPELVSYAETFDDFTDRFRGKAVNCQADCIRWYVKEGRKSYLQRIQPLLQAFREHGIVPRP